MTTMEVIVIKGALLVVVISVELFPLFLVIGSKLLV